MSFLNLFMFHLALILTCESYCILLLCYNLCFAIFFCNNYFFISLLFLDALFFQFCFGGKTRSWYALLTCNSTEMHLPLYAECWN